MVKLKLTRRGLLAVAGSPLIALLRPRTGPAMTVPWVGEPSNAENTSPITRAIGTRTGLASFGGLDHPRHRNNDWPAGFTPKENPFYVALPFGELGEGDRLKADAATFPGIGRGSIPC